MKKFFKLQEYFSYEDGYISQEQLQNFDKYRLRYNSPLKPRGPTPPKSRESSPKVLTQPRSITLRHSSVGSNNIFVLKVPFSGVNFINQSKTLQNNNSNQKQTKRKRRKNNTCKRNRRSESLEL